MQFQRFVKRFNFAICRAPILQTVARSERNRDVVGQFGDHFLTQSTPLFFDDAKGLAANVGRVVKSDRNVPIGKAVKRRQALQINGAAPKSQNVDR